MTIERQFKSSVFQSRHQQFTIDLRLNRSFVRKDFLSEIPDLFEIVISLVTTEEDDRIKWLRLLLVATNREVAPGDYHTIRDLQFKSRSFFLFDLNAEEDQQGYVSLHLSYIPRCFFQTLLTLRCECIKLPSHTKKKKKQPRFVCVSAYITESQ
jgi:hypothetical protein